LDKLVNSWTKDYTHYEVMEILQRAGVAAGPSVNVEELVNDRQLHQRGFFVELDHPNPEVEKGLNSRAPWRLSALPDIVYQRAPRIGEHNDYVFRELLGLSEEEIARLTEEQVII
jgi:crotonobetainyl-CoA:carnitine CoA-transferase CaiB-like acyl-CoA transferase